MDEPWREDQGGFDFDGQDRPIKVARPTEPFDPQSLPPLPDERAPLTAKRAIVEMLFVILVMVAASVARAYWMGGGLLDKDAQPDMWLYGSVIIGGSVVTAAIFLVLVYGRHSWRSVGLWVQNIPGEIKAAAAALVMIYVLQWIIGSLVFYFWPSLVRGAAEDRMELARMFPKLSLPALLAFTLFVGFYEELLFRGFLQTRLTAVVKNGWAAVVVASLLFGAVHYYQDPLAMFQIFTVSLVLGGLFQIHKSLLAPMLVHAVFDFINLLAAMNMDKIMRFYEQTSK